MEVFQQSSAVGISMNQIDDLNDQQASTALLRVKFPVRQTCFCEFKKSNKKLTD